MGGDKDVLCWSLRCVIAHGCQREAKDERNGDQRT